MLSVYYFNLICVITVKFNVRVLFTGALIKLTHWLAWVPCAEKKPLPLHSKLYIFFLFLDSRYNHVEPWSSNNDLRCQRKNVNGWCWEWSLLWERRGQTEWNSNGNKEAFSLREAGLWWLKSSVSVWYIDTESLENSLLVTLIEFWRMKSFKPTVNNVRTFSTTTDSTRPDM